MSFDTSREGSLESWVSIAETVYRSYRSYRSENIPVTRTVHINNSSPIDGFRRIAH
jgi:hypothetical protein